MVNKKGFTLVELMVVVLIVAILFDDAVGPVPASLCSLENVSRHALHRTIRMTTDNHFNIDLHINAFADRLLSVVQPAVP